MDRFTHTLVALLTASSSEETASAALQALVDQLPLDAACLLLWDAELGRYIIGDTWPGANGQTNAANLRRMALQIGQTAHQSGPDRMHCLESGVLYLPLNQGQQHVGALIGFGVRCRPQLDENTTLLLRAITRALHAIMRLEQADREHAQLEAERERLEQILAAVERQQRTIDRLLAAEREQSALLEAKVEARTAELQAAQHRLIQSEKLAVIGQLASSLAHELNNPLQAIQSGLGLVLAELDGDNMDVVRDDLHTIQEELERIDAIFRQMLDFYRPVSYDCVPLDLNAICEGVRVLMRKRLQETSVTLRLDLTPHLPLTCGDSNQIKQVLINLILNAAEAIDRAGGTITLRTAHDRAYAIVEVRDDGPGIAEEHRAHLFEPLFTTKPRGMGLGLAISQDIIQHHGGRITLESAPGDGTTFTIWLPVRESCNGNGEIAGC